MVRWIHSASLGGRPGNRPSTDDPVAPGGNAVVEAKSNGKLILLGEHSVVYGRTALAVGIADALKVEACSADAALLRLEVPSWGVAAQEDDRDGLGELLRFVRDRTGLSRAIFHVETWLPCRAGLGSSAALCVALLRAAYKCRGQEPEPGLINRFARDAERIFHDRPSGIDNTTSVYGGACLFLGEGRAEAPAGFERLDAGAPGVYTAPTDLRLLIGDTGIKRDTARVVRDVRRMWSRDRQGVEAVFDEMDRLALEGAAALSSGDYPRLGRVMTRCHEQLTLIDVSHPLLDEMVDAALKAGALGAKLTGAGRGGCGVALLPASQPDTAREVAEAWMGLGISCRVADLRGGGEVPEC